MLLLSHAGSVLSPAEFLLSCAEVVSSLAESVLSRPELALSCAGFVLSLAESVLSFSELVLSWLTQLSKPAGGV